MMMKTAPASSFIVPQAKFLLQFFVVPFNDPALLCPTDQVLEFGLRRESGEPVPPPGHPADSCFRYMIDRTLYRPREIIQFCTEVVELARSRTSGLPLPYAAISWAERGYSEERAKDIAAEYRFQYPGLLSVFEVFRGRSPTFDRENLQFLCLELATGGVPTGDTGSWLPDRDPDDLIDILCHVGFLEGQPAGGAISGDPLRSFLGVHQVQHLNLALVQYFRVHAMFRAYLGLA